MLARADPKRSARLHQAGKPSRRFTLSRARARAMLERSETKDERRIRDCPWHRMRLHLAQGHRRRMGAPLGVWQNKKKERERERERERYARAKHRAFE
jgi:hypothetical protein